MNCKPPNANRLPGGWPARLWLFWGTFLGMAAQGQEDTNFFPTLAPPEGELPASFWEQHETAIIVGGLVLLVAGIFYWLGRLRPAKPTVLPPETEARRALSTCASRPEDGRLLSEVSRIVRRYAAAVFALPPGEATTAEFCARLAENDRAGAEVGGSFARFLRECDERKFSPQPAAAPVNAVASALELIARAEARRTAVRQTQAAS